MPDAFERIQEGARQAAEGATVPLEGLRSEDGSARGDI